MVQLSHYQQDDENQTIRAAEGGVSPLSSASPPRGDRIRTDAAAMANRSLSRDPATRSTEQQQQQQTTTTTTEEKRPSSDSQVTPQHHHQQQQQQQRSATLGVRFKKEFRRRVLHTTPSWFAVNMGTGITSILLHQLPYQFNGLDVIANIIFGINVALFCILLAISITRYTIWPSMFWTMLYHPSQSLFLGTFPMGFTTIINMIVYSLVPAWGPAWITVAWVLWWIDSAVSLLIAIGIPFIQFTRHSQSFDQITGVWFLPVVTTVVAAATGANVASVLDDPAHVRLTVIASYILWGTGFPLSIMLMTLYYARLAIYKIPPAAMIVSAFLPLGPCGQGAFGLLQLAEVIVNLTERTRRMPLGGVGDYGTARIVAYAIQGVTIPVALVIWGLGLVWLALAVATITDMTAASIVPFNMGWWGFTFPLGTFATATTQLGRQLESRSLLILGTVFSAIVALLWLLLFCMTGWRAVTGTMFFSPCLAEQGGEPPALVAPARKYVYNPRPPASSRGDGRDSTSRSRSRSLSRPRLLLGSYFASSETLDGGVGTWRAGDVAGSVVRPRCRSAEGGEPQSESSGPPGW